MVHEWLLNVKKEADEPDISPAYRLMDLLDCHRCVQHVAQVYLKGIMGDASPVFGMQSILTETEAALIAARAADPKLRVNRTMPQTKQESVPKEDPASAAGPVRIRPEDLTDGQPVRVFDVRSPEEFAQGHLPGAIHIPLEQCIREPEAIPARKDEKICFVCTKGVKSRLAANAAFEAGYAQVSYAAMETQQ